MRPLRDPATRCGLRPALVPGSTRRNLFTQLLGLDLKKSLIYYCTIILLFISVNITHSELFAARRDVGVSELTIKKGNGSSSFYANDDTIIRCRWNRVHAGKIFVELSIDGKRVELKTYEKGTGGGGTLMYRWRALGGEHTFVCKAWIASGKGERNRRNNKKTLKKIIPHLWPSVAKPDAKLPDLYVKSLKYEALDNRNDAINLVITIGNRGKADYDGTKCWVDIETKKVYGDKLIRATATLDKRLRPGRTTQVKQQYRGMWGYWNVIIEVDRNKKVKESNEVNNIFKKDDFVIPHIWPGAR